MLDLKNIVFVTNRKLCDGDYLAQLDKVLSMHPDSLILREKDLDDAAYEELAGKAMELCAVYEVPFYIHSHWEIAAKLGCRNIHLSIPALRELAGIDAEENADGAHLHDDSGFERISVSCHSIEDVQEACRAGATRIVLGNIFETDCKKGLPGKGLNFLSEICRISTVPVYGIGGIDLDRLPMLLEVGAAGGCMMSGLMRL